jgi:hypothetical protein
MRRTIAFAIAALLAGSPALAQTAPDDAASAPAASGDAAAAPKPQMKRVCKVKDSGNPMRPDRICHMVPIAGTVAAQPVVQTSATAPRTDQMAQNAAAPHL